MRATGLNKVSVYTRNGPQEVTKTHTHTHITSQAHTHMHKHTGIYSLVIKKTKEVSVITGIRQLCSLRRELILIFKAYRQKEALQMKCFKLNMNPSLLCHLVHPSIHLHKYECTVWFGFLGSVFVNCGAVLLELRGERLDFFSPLLIVFHFCKGFDFHVDGAVLITRGNCPGEMRQSDKIRRADPHPDKKTKRRVTTPHGD